MILSVKTAYQRFFVSQKKGTEMADQLIQITNERIQQLIALKAKLPKGKQPTGRLRVITNHDRSQYYLVDKGSNSNGSEPDEDFIAAWQHLPYTGKPFEINAPEFFTSTGVRVRSKSEIIIADALDRAGIPYRYEFPASIKGWGTLYPDFTGLDVRTRKEIIWEHFGLMGDTDYSENTLQKIAHYAASGYILGKNLIATFESGTTPLSAKQVQGYIKAHFK